MPISNPFQPPTGTPSAPAPTVDPNDPSTWPTTYTPPPNGGNIGDLDPEGRPWPSNSGGVTNDPTRANQPGYDAYGYPVSVGPRAGGVGSNGAAQGLGGISSTFQNNAGNPIYYNNAGGAAAPTQVSFDMQDPFAGFTPQTPVGQAIPGAEGLNMLAPGAAESYFQQHQKQFGAPTMSQGFARGKLNQYAGGTPGVAQNAQDAYDRFQASTPADMSSYYANAGRQAEERLNMGMAAKGMYGSSAANDQMSEALTNLAADRARNEAQYGITRANTAGSLAQGADTSSRGASANEQSWMQGLGGLAQGADTSGVNSLMAGTNAAQGAQQAQTTRGQNMFGNQMAYGNAIAGTMGPDYQNMFTGDQSLIQGMTNGLVGIGAEGVNQASQNSAQARADATTANNQFNTTAQNFGTAANAINTPGSTTAPGTGPGAGPAPGSTQMAPTSGTGPGWPYDATTNPTGYGAPTAGGPAPVMAPGASY